MIKKKNVPGKGSVDSAFTELIFMISTIQKLVIAVAHGMMEFWDDWIPYGLSLECGNESHHQQMNEAAFPIPACGFIAFYSSKVLKNILILKFWLWYGGIFEISWALSNRILVRKDVRNLRKEEVYLVEKVNILRGTLWNKWHWSWLRRAWTYDLASE